jgi:sugar lactone lactonase YvrE
MKLLSLRQATARPGVYSLVMLAALGTARAQNTITTVAGGANASGNVNTQSQAPSQKVRRTILPNISKPGPMFLNRTLDESALVRRGAISGARPIAGRPPSVHPFVVNHTYADIPGPSAVVTDGVGTTYFASPDAQMVYKIDASNTVSIVAGIGYSTEDALKFDGGPATSASLNEPTGLALDNKGNLFIADMTNYLIRRVDTNGTITTIAGNTHLCNDPTTLCGDGQNAMAAQMSYPTGIATDAAGNVYIADTVDNRVRVVNLQSTAITVAGVHINPGAINTIAGNGTPCAGGTNACGDGGSAKAANLNNPQGVAVDAAGNVYIADSGDRRIRVVSKQGVITTYAGNGRGCFTPLQGCGDGGSALAAQITNPWQISLDSAGNLYITDPPESRIRMVSAADGTITTVAGTGAPGYNGDYQAPTTAQLNAARGVWVDSTGTLTIGDTGNGLIRSVASGTITPVTGGGNGGDSGPATSAVLAADHDVALDAAGNLYIADTSNNRIRMMATDGNIYTVAGNGKAGYQGDDGPAVTASLSAPFGLTVDGSGNIYIADTYNYAIRFVDQSTGTISTIAGNGMLCAKATSPCGDGGPATSASFIRPTTVALDANGNLYVADAGANKIRVVNAAGMISTFAGTGAVCGNSLAGACGDNGPATSAQLYGPMGVAVDAAGNVYISDTNDNRIRKVDTTGTITAYAFTGKNAFGPDKVNALGSSYNTPQYIAVDPRGNLYVSGSDFFYVIQRISALNGTVISVAGPAGDPKYYGFEGDGGPAANADLNNFGVAINGTGDLYVADGGNNRVRHVALTPIATATATKLTFAPQQIGQTSPPQSFGLVNQGTDDLVISGTPVVTGDFALTAVNGTTCAQNLIAPLDRCTYTLTFTPTGYGVRTGNITISDNAYGHPTQVIALVGQAPDFTISAAPNVLTLSPGGVGYSTATFAPVAGFNQTIAVSCGAPKGITCAASPTSVTLDGSDAATSTLTITVSASTAPGTYTLRPTGTSVVTHESVITLTVAQGGNPITPAARLARARALRRLPF